MIVLPVSAGIACTMSSGNKVLHELIMNKNKENKKLYERDQQTIKSFDNIYRNSFQDNIIDKNEYESLCNVFNNCLDETKKESFLKK